MPSSKTQTIMQFPGRMLFPTVANPPMLRQPPDPQRYSEQEEAAREIVRRRGLEPWKEKGLLIFTKDGQTWIFREQITVLWLGGKLHATMGRRSNYAAIKAFYEKQLSTVVAVAQGTLGKVIKEGLLTPEQLVSDGVFTR
jgi:hypothetical protein